MKVVNEWVRDAEIGFEIDRMMTGHFRAAIGEGEPLVVLARGVNICPSSNA